MATLLCLFLLSASKVGSFWYCYSRVSKAAICIDTDQKRAFLAPLRALQCDNVLAEPAIPINRLQQSSASVLAQPHLTCMPSVTDLHGLLSGVTRPSILPAKCELYWKGNLNVRSLVGRCFSGGTRYACAIRRKPSNSIAMDQFF
jgi:hypothetical protein